MLTHEKIGSLCAGMLIGIFISYMVSFSSREMMLKSTVEIDEPTPLTCPELGPTGDPLESSVHEECSYRGQFLQSTQSCWCLALYEGDNCEKEKPPRIRERQQLVVLADDLNHRDYKPNLPLSVEESEPYFPTFDSLQNTTYRSCALVGTGGALVLKKYGFEIDNHDAIFRSNLGPTKGFEKYVGKRTTYRFSFPPLCAASVAQDSRVFPEEMPTVLCFHPLKTPLMGKYFINSHRHANFIKEEMNRSYKNMKEDSESTLGFYALDYTFEKRIRKIVTSPTTGFMSIQIAIQMCEYLDLYGYTMGDAWADMDEANSQDFPSTFIYHYYDISEHIYRAGNPHKYNVERRELLKMEMDGYLVNRHRKHNLPKDLNDEIAKEGNGQ